MRSIVFLSKLAFCGRPPLKAERVFILINLACKKAGFKNEKFRWYRD